jgi:hypothetical protein
VEFCGGVARVLLLTGGVARVLLLAGGGARVLLLAGGGEEEEGQQGANSPPSPHQHSTPLVSATKQKLNKFEHEKCTCMVSNFFVLYAKKAANFCGNRVF